MELERKLEKAEAEKISRKRIRRDKQELDKANKDQRPTIIGKKCKVCGKIHPLIRYHWIRKTSTDSYPALQILIFASSDELLERIFDAEKVLTDIGIHFDTGYGYARDWEFDWSLTGEHYIFDEDKKEWIKIDRSTWG